LFFRGAPTHARALRAIERCASGGTYSPQRAEKFPATGDASLVVCVVESSERLLRALRASVREISGAGSKEM
jgi:hypothetical protein